MNDCAYKDFIKDPSTFNNFFRKKNKIESLKISKQNNGEINGQSKVNSTN